jgi:hypothetical protein
VLAQALPSHCPHIYSQVETPGHTFQPHCGSGAPCLAHGHCLHFVQANGIAADGEEHLPQPSRRSYIHDPCSLPKPVCCHRVSTPRVCRLCAPLLGRVPPVWALSWVTLRVLCACGWSVWQALTHGWPRPLPSQDGTGATGSSFPAAVGHTLSKIRSHSRSGLARSRDGRTAIGRTVTVAVAMRVAVQVVVGWGK